MSVFSRTGEYGVDIMDTTDAQTGSWFCITFLSDTQFSSLTSNATIDGSIGDYTFPKGSTLYAKITGFTLTSGSIVAYKNPS